MSFLDFEAFRAQREIQRRQEQEKNKPKKNYEIRLDLSRLAPQPQKKTKKKNKEKRQNDSKFKKEKSKKKGKQRSEFINQSLKDELEKQESMSKNENETNEFQQTMDLRQKTIEKLWKIFEKHCCKCASNDNNSNNNDDNGSVVLSAPPNKKRKISQSANNNNSSNMNVNNTRNNEKSKIYPICIKIENSIYNQQLSLIKELNLVSKKKKKKSKKAKFKNAKKSNENSNDCQNEINDDNDNGNDNDTEMINDKIGQIDENENELITFENNSLFKKYYLDKTRDLLFNIKKNENLQISIINNLVSINELISMNYFELANENLQKQRKISNSNISNVISLTFEGDGGLGSRFGEWIQSETIKCEKCDQMECEYEIKRKFSDNRKNEIWGNKLDDEIQIVNVRCTNKQCNHVFKKEIFY